ncbi:MFS transporter [Pseudonocardia spinosispora]|uniref:MFS transporter n=1 Tax=Pseudonocardia spinosispora TaxID=103441 RepID=UPI000429907E|nr:MFS transporter [Pseudonocardia spinosispora]
MPFDHRSLKIAAISWAGASIEWYDFFIYGTASALVFPALFFPTSTALVSSALAFATFGVAFLARPLGGAVFGHVGDRYGRKRALVASLLIMGVSTTAIGVLPSFAQIGLWAPIILVVLRFVQGVTVGGQQGGMMLLATENVPPGRRGFYGSFASAGAPGGVVLANLAFLAVTFSMSGTSFSTWGWRLPFLASLPLIGLAVFIQLRIDETDEFRQAAASAGAPKRRSPLIEVLRDQPRQVLLTAGSYLAVNLNYYLFITFVVAYATNPHFLGVSQSTALLAVLLASTVELALIPVFGLLSDRIGHRRVFVGGAVLLGVWSFAFWPLVNSRSPELFLVALVVGLGVAHSVIYAPQPALFTEAFSTRVRYSGLSLGVQLGSLLGGAFAPFIATTLLAEFGSTLPISIYTAAACLVTVFCGLTIGRRTARHPLPERV